MKKVGRTLGVVAAVVGVAVTAAGCGDNVIGSDGPRPGIAAEVEDSQITLDELASVVDGLCTLQEADPAAAATSRAYAQSQILQAWVGALVDEEYADDNDLDITAPASGLKDAPGWADVDEDDQDALEDYVNAFVYASAVTEQIGQGEGPDPADYAISINPKFDVMISATGFVPAGAQLSVPVSKEAKIDTAAPSPESLQDLSNDEICGVRPAPTSPESALPIPQG
ncbi:hypothetical protein F0U44_10650 [Nocardioides humilatus]|uniref:Lipoprotein n=1 Tax=Nocardioides humilatus TaxID=2607660 RepID=A0A5B1LEP5_9ACTN|nr:hypothetical protein [Nocardioides humilatus]KAA1418926.1 hypothetical protein F0U44_10650 [Nocardioides humilatus]